MEMNNEWVKDPKVFNINRKRHMPQYIAMPL